MPKINNPSTFWERVARLDTNDCWIWIGCQRGNGYGQVHYSGRPIAAHRVAYELSFGKVPQGLVVMHSCDNRLCCNPNHLKAGTVQQNNADMFSKMRHAYGEKVGTAKFSDQQIELIRSAKWGSVHATADAIGMSYSHAACVRARKDRKIESRKS